MSTPSAFFYSPVFWGRIDGAFGGACGALGGTGVPTGPGGVAFANGAPVADFSGFPQNSQFSRLSDVCWPQFGHSPFGAAMVGGLKHISFSWIEYSNNQHLSCLSGLEIDIYFIKNNHSDSYLNHCCMHYKAKKARI
jgi:hypothetical protein